ncbi:MAG: CinA family protein [Candidatus Flexifilum sp.]|jgi:PncC family amidohydrolase
MSEPIDSRLEAQVGAALRARGWTVAAAESCTGGLVLHRLTNIPGSSAYVLGGVVAYDNAIKQRVLGVHAETLARFGAVSEETAIAMARGVLALIGADCAVSITGIAGPGGGTPEKPVGLAYFAAVTRTGLLRTHRQIAPGDREAVKAASADAALRLLLDLIAEERA